MRALITGGRDLANRDAASSIVCPFTDAQLAAIVDAMGGFEAGQIQGFRYGDRLGIRNCMRRPGRQEIWTGNAGTDDAAFHRQCEIERLRAAISIRLADATGSRSAAGILVQKAET